MLTSKLEDLIWKGKAFPKTFCVGGTQKHVLNIKPGRFIIITDILYFPFCANQNPDSDKVAKSFDEIQKWISINKISTQLTILGEKNFNRFQFRNNINFINNIPPVGEEIAYLALPATPIHLDTYLIHTTGVSFTFSNGVPFINIDGTNLPETTAYAPPTDYGKIGDSNVFSTTQIQDVSTGTTQWENYFSRTAPALGYATTNELSYPVDDITNIESTQRKFGNQHPIVQVSYVEILGTPNNVGL